MVEIYVGSSGIPLNIAIVKADGKPLDLTSATTVDVVLKNPSTKNTRTGEFVDREKGKCSYTLTSSDLSVAGEYQVQAIAKLPGKEYPSSIYSFNVKDRL